MHSKYDSPVCTSSSNGIEFLPASAQVVRDIAVGAHSSLRQPVYLLLDNPPIQRFMVGFLLFTEKLKPKHNFLYIRSNTREKTRETSLPLVLRINQKIVHLQSAWKEHRDHGSEPYRFLVMVHHRVLPSRTSLTLTEEAGTAFFLPWWSRNNWKKEQKKAAFNSATTA